VEALSACPPFGEGKIPGLSRPFSSKFKDLELGKIFETDLPYFIRLYFIR
jgi:hypothetical protein